MTTVQLSTLVISLIGAAAWLPHLVTLFRKPQLTIIPSRSCQIGFTELGPIFNFNAAVTAGHKSVLIDLIELNIKHESGDAYKFRWHEIKEIKGQMVLPGIQNQPIYQESEAIAIKVLPTDFKYLSFQNRMESHTQEIKKYNYEIDRERHRSINASQYKSDAFYSSSCVQNIQQFMQTQMIWKKGQYHVYISLHNLNKAAVNLPVLTFSLSEDDIVLLQINCSNMPKLLRNTCLTEEEHSQLEPLEWHWLEKDLRANVA